jgi:hypothetical protein
MSAHACVKALSDADMALMHMVDKNDFTTTSNYIRLLAEASRACRNKPLKAKARIEEAVRESWRDAHLELRGAAVDTATGKGWLR